MSVSVRLENVIIAFPHLFEKHSFTGDQNSPARYGADFIIDPVTNVAAFNAATNAFRQAVTEAGKAALLDRLKSPVQVGNQVNLKREENGKTARPELFGKYLVKAYDSEYAPNVRNAANQLLTAANRDQIFSGCVVNASVDFYWHTRYSAVFVGLKGVQLINNVNVERISSGGIDPETQFEPVAGNVAPLQPAQDNPGPAPLPQETPPWL